MVGVASWQFATALNTPRQICFGVCIYISSIGCQRSQHFTASP